MFSQHFWQFRSFARRLAVWMAVLLLLLLTGIYFAIENTLERNARSTLNQALEVTAATLTARLSDQRGVLLDKLRLLSADFAFKQVFADGDRDTLRSALENHRNRVHANVMQLIDLDGKVLVSTDPRDQENQKLPDHWLLTRASEHEFGEAAGFVFVHQELVQYVVSPFFTPQHSAWVVMGIRLDAAFIETLRTQTHSEVTVFWQNTERVRIAGRLPENPQEEAQLLTDGDITLGDARLPTLGGRHYLHMPVLLESQPQGKATAVLLRSFDEAMTPFYRLRNVLLALCCGSLLLAVLASSVLARRVTNPVRRLGESAQALAKGEYLPVQGVNQQDELGTLATQFNHMLHGLQERDAVRGLLGKVVSTAVAEELLKSPPILGGELRTITVMFTDIRNFTRLSEQFPATTVIEFLNAYLSEMSSCIDAECGVVDKYIGDAIMALFGAPLPNHKHTENAVRAALAMQQVLAALQQTFTTRGWPALHTGIGIHTGEAVVGNMGSAQRLNYTAIGDTVNLASRLEGLCKYYGWPVLVSDAVVQATPQFAYLELDRVRVQGRAQPVGVFAALTPQQQTMLHADAQTQDFEQAVQAWRRGDIEQVPSLLSAIHEGSPLATVAALYRVRCQVFTEQGMPDHWQGVYDYDSK